MNVEWMPSQNSRASRPVICFGAVIRFSTVGSFHRTLIMETGKQPSTNASKSASPPSALAPGLSEPPAALGPVREQSNWGRDGIPEERRRA